MGEPLKLQRIAVEILFDNADDLHRAMPGLIEHDFEVLYLDDWFNDWGGTTAWMLAWTFTRLDTDGFVRLVDDLVEPFGGFVWEWGVTDDAELEEWKARGRTPAADNLIDYQVGPAREGIQ
jgi:hypothetical protein